MLRGHLMGIQLMRRLPWPLALPVRWFSVGDPDRPSATSYAQLYHLSLTIKHGCFRPILRPWHGRYHDDKSDTGPASFGTASLIPLKPQSKSIDRIGIRLRLCSAVGIHDGCSGHTTGNWILLIGLVVLCIKVSPTILILAGEGETFFIWIIRYLFCYPSDQQDIRLHFGIS